MQLTCQSLPTSTHFQWQQSPSTNKSRHPDQPWFQSQPQREVWWQTSHLRDREPPLARVPLLGFSSAVPSLDSSSSLDWLGWTSPLFDLIDTSHQINTLTKSSVTNKILRLVSLTLPRDVPRIREHWETHIKPSSWSINITKPISDQSSIFLAYNIVSVIFENTCY